MSDSAPARRIVLLGASNVAKSISTAVSVARNAYEGDLDLMAAMGHGRAYTCGTWVLGRRLPAIETCALWDDLESRPQAPLTAVVMDVGNDIIFSRSAESILQSISRCLDRLQSLEAEINIIGLPLPVLEALPSWRFQLFRRLFFPMSKMQYESGLQTAREVHERLRSRAAECGAAFIEQESKWYGLDPIHLQRRSWDAAWKKFFSIRHQRALAQPSRLAPGRFLYLRTRRPAWRQLFGVTQTQPQPVGRLSCGVDISWY